MTEYPKIYNRSLEEAVANGESTEWRKSFNLIYRCADDIEQAIDGNYDGRRLDDECAYEMVSLIIQQLYREILSVADENGGKLKNRCVFFCDEFGTVHWR